jgi:hypothetical protein
MTSCWYLVFFDPGDGTSIGPQEKAHILSSDTFDGRASEFRAWLRMPLYKVEALADQFMDRGWVRPTNCYSDPTVFCIRVHLLIMGCLDRLGNGTQYCKLCAVTHISTMEHYTFFNKFLDKMCSISRDWISSLEMKKNYVGW